MAEVWRGVHEGQQVPVAVKVLTGPRAQDPDFTAALKFGLRQVPFVGRFAERDRLWSTLEPALAGTDAVVVVRGAAGVDALAFVLRTAEGFTQVERHPGHARRRRRPRCP